MKRQKRFGKVQFSGGCKNDEKVIFTTLLCLLNLRKRGNVVSMKNS